MTTHEDDEAIRNALPVPFTVADVGYGKVRLYSEKQTIAAVKAALKRAEKSYRFADDDLVWIAKGNRSQTMSAAEWFDAAQEQGNALVAFERGRQKGLEECATPSPIPQPERAEPTRRAVMKDGKVVVELSAAPESITHPEPLYHLKQYGDVTEAQMDYYIEHGTLDGFTQSEPSDEWIDEWIDDAYQRLVQACNVAGEIPPTLPTFASAIAAPFTQAQEARPLSEQELNDPTPLQKAKGALEMLIHNCDPALGHIDKEREDACRYGEEILDDIYVALAATQPAQAQEAPPILRMALQMLYDDAADYIRLNNLGGMDNQCMRLAREALAAPDVKAPSEARGSFMTPAQAVHFWKRRHPDREPTEQQIAASIDAYAALFGDLVPVCIEAQQPPDYWPSAKVTVHEDGSVTASLYAPGLPPGTHDLYLPDVAAQAQEAPVLSELLLEACTELSAIASSGRIAQLIQKIKHALAAQSHPAPPIPEAPAGDKR